MDGLELVMVQFDACVCVCLLTRHGTRTRQTHFGRHTYLHDETSCLHFLPRPTNHMRVARDLPRRGCRFSLIPNSAIHSFMTKQGSKTNRENPPTTIRERAMETQSTRHWLTRSAVCPFVSIHTTTPPVTVEQIESVLDRSTPTDKPTVRPKGRW